jgi:hypothetical protein
VGSRTADARVVVQFLTLKIRCSTLHVLSKHHNTTTVLASGGQW